MTTPAIDDRTETPQEPTTEELTQWADDSERLESTQEGAPESPAEIAPESSPEPSAELVEAQAQIAQLTRERDDRQQEADAAQLENTAREMALKYAQGLVANGYSEDQARAQAESERLRWVAEERLKLVQTREQSLHLSYGARELSRIHGVSVESLQKFPSIESMTEHAQMAGGIQKRLTALEQKTGQESRNEAAPVQQYSEQGRPGGGGKGNSAYVQSLKNGGALPSSAEIDKLTEKFRQ